MGHRGQAPTKAWAHRSQRDRREQTKAQRSAWSKLLLLLLSHQWSCHFQSISTMSLWTDELYCYLLGPFVPGFHTAASRVSVVHGLLCNACSFHKNDLKVNSRSTDIRTDLIWRAHIKHACDFLLNWLEQLWCNTQANSITWILNLNWSLVENYRHRTHLTAEADVEIIKLEFHYWKEIQKYT